MNEELGLGSEEESEGLSRQEKVKDDEENNDDEELMKYMV